MLILHHAILTTSIFLCMSWEVARQRSTKRPNKSFNVRDLNIGQCIDALAASVGCLQIDQKPRYENWGEPVMQKCELIDDIDKMMMVSMIYDSTKIAPKLSTKSSISRESTDCMVFNG